MNGRYYSLDVFRGMTVAFMILVNNPGTWHFIFDPLEHAAWHGCTPTDLVFPFFLFAVGNAMAFVMPRLREAGPAVFWKKVSKRTLLIFGIGLLLLAWAPYFYWKGDTLAFKGWEYVTADGQVRGIRLLGVLQRIALCYFFASVIIFYSSRKAIFWWAAGILLVYWALCLLLGNSGDPYSIDGWFGARVDVAILGPRHIYTGEGGKLFDPEGFMSTLPAIVSVMFGYLVGEYVQRKGKTYHMLSHLFVAGALFTLAGLAWNLAFPFNKKIWTSSYVVYSTGLAMTVLAVLIFIIELKQQKGGWSRFFDVFGKNPLFIFVLSGFLPRVLGLVRIPNGLTNSGQPQYITPFGWFYEFVCKLVPGPPEIGSFVYALCMLAFYWAIAWWMDREKIYVKV